MQATTRSTPLGPTTAFLVPAPYPDGDQAPTIPNVMTEHEYAQLDLILGVF
jgi:hypothetical protein